MVCAPTLSVDVVNVATPLPLSVAVPSGFAPSVKVTVPVGVPEPLVTVAVKVTACPKVLGLNEVVSVVVVGVAARAPAGANIPTHAASTTATASRGDRRAIPSARVHTSASDHRRLLCPFCSPCGSLATPRACPRTGANAPTIDSNNRFFSSCPDRITTPRPCGGDSDVHATEHGSRPQCQDQQKSAVCQVGHSNTDHISS